MSIDCIRVLLVEDSRTDVLLIHEALMGQPNATFVITAVEYLADARQQLGQAECDVVLLDLGLPDSQRLATLVALREHAPHMPIIVLTGLADEAIGLHALQAGAQDYLVKGQIAGDGLARAIRYAIERTRAEAENTRLYQLAQAEIAERQRVGAILRESQERLAGIVGSAMDAIISIDATQRIVVFNIAAEQMFGCSAAETLGQPIERFIPYEFRDVHASHIQAFGQTGVTSRSMHSPGNLTALRMDGTAFPIEATISQTVAAGQPLYTVIMRDINARTEAQAALRQSELQYHLLFDTMLHGAVYHDHNGQITMMNPAAERILGRGIEELSGQTSEDLEHVTLREDGLPFQGSEHPAMVALRTGQAVPNTLMQVFNSREQTYRWINISAVPLFSHGAAQPDRVYAIFEDITDRKHAEEQLHYQADLLAQVSDAIISTDSSFTIKSWNAAAEALYGWTAQEVIGKPMRTIVPTNYLDHDSQRAQAILFREERWHGEVTQQRRDGTKCSILSSVSLLKDHAGKPLGAVAVNRDITDRKRAEAALQRSSERLQVLADASRAFAEVGTEYQALLEQVAHTTAAVLGEGCSIRLLSEDQEWLNLVALYDIDFEAINLMRIILGETPLSVHESSLTTRIFHNRQPLLIPVVDREQVRAATKQAYWSLVDRLGIHSMLGVPMQVQGRVIGVVIVYRRLSEQPPFDADDLTLAQDLADRAALASANARLLMQVQHELAERTSAEQALRQSEAHFATAFRANPAAMSITRLQDGCFIDINASHERLFGYQRAELIGQHATSISIYANPDQRAEVVRIMREQGSLRDTELTLRTKSGELREVLCSLESIELAGEACMLGSVVDITDRKRAEAALQRAADRLQVLADASRAFAEVGTEYQALLDHVARTIATVLGEGCIIRLLSEDGMWLNVVALCDLDAEKLDLTRIVLGDAPLRVNEQSLTTRIFHSGQSLLIPVVDREQIRAATKPAYWSLADRLNIHSLFGVPMQVQGHTIGVVIVYRRLSEQSSFGADDLTLAKDLADRAALAISNVRLLQQVQHELAERTSAEAAVRASEENLRIVTETAGIGLALVDADHRYRYTNQTHKDFLHLPVGDLVRQHVADVLGSLYEQAVRKRLDRAFAGEFVSDYLDLPVSPGIDRHCEVRLKLGTYRTDPVVVVVLTDITERKRAEQALQRAAERLRVLADASRAFAEAGTEYQALLDQVAQTTAAVLGEGCNIRLLSKDQEWLDLVALYDKDTEKRELTRMVLDKTLLRVDEPSLATQILHSGQPLFIPTIDQEQAHAATKPEYWSLVERLGIHSRILVPMRVQGRTIGVLGLYRYRREQPPFDADDLSLAQDLADRAALAISNARLLSQVQYELTERTKAEVEVRALSADLEQRVLARTTELTAANKELEAFSYSISHDLRSPLRAIDGFSRILLEDYVAALPDEAQHYFQLMRSNAQQMGHLIDDLLAFSRLSRQPLRTQAVDPTALVRQCLDELRVEQAGRVIDVQLGDLPACQADPALLKQVWINLLTNALKYTRLRDPAIIVIGCQIVGDETIYSVRDNGVGFDMRYSDKLFGVFQRMHRAEDYEGTGVGLAIIQRIIHRHGGRIWAEAAIDQGATFSFTLGAALL